MKVTAEFACFEVAVGLVLLLAVMACSKTPEQQTAQAQTAQTAAAGTPTPAAPGGKQDPATLPHFNGQRALQYAGEVVSYGPRWVGSPGYAKTQAYLRSQLKGVNVVEDTFTASTPAGSMRMTNIIAKFPGKKDGIIVVAGHYDTIYNRQDFVGANDGGSSTGLPLELAHELRGKNNDGYSIWIVFFDGEEAVKQWTKTDSVYGSRHLASVWEKDGTLKKIKAFLLVDMVGDADLDILRDLNSTPWLLDVVYQAATSLGYQSHFFARATPMEDDHLPFAHAGVPVADLIDYDYGPNNGYWHSPQDTMDKLGAHSLEIVGSVLLQTIQLLNQH